MAVFVWRPGPRGREWLVLHRAVLGPEYEGDWAWSPPGGGLEPDEEPAAGARRELREETGLDLPCVPVLVDHPQVAFYVAEARRDLEVHLSSEHDRYEWLPTDVAARRCRQEWVGEVFSRVE